MNSMSLTKPKTILLVEDNADDEEFTRRALIKCRIKNELHVVRDGAEALDYLFCRGAFATRDPHELPQLVLLDLKLPKIEGHEVLKEIRAQSKTALLPVIILTSSKEESDLMKGYKGGANSYIVKPVDQEQFSECVQQLGLYWLVLNEGVPQS